MTESPLWVTGPGNIWCVPNPNESRSPIRRGTAKRLGLHHPELARPPMSMTEWIAGLEAAAKQLSLTGITFGQFTRRRSQ